MTADEARASADVVSGKQGPIRLFNPTRIQLRIRIRIRIPDQIYSILKRRQRFIQTNFFNYKKLSMLHPTPPPNHHRRPSEHTVRMIQISAIRESKSLSKSFD
ncbi:hypothetical protein L6452_33591 [Arctium lappa]|uniref:Uncharacterized protein n=1 Tax=Arctium lappa TaxID=4217 RepID=A0ACB8YGG3_ARCLA|nr:hypothetical protein L6452_33591 [Arctium lappa]